ncbi:hypothetical protein A1Q2_00550 [Trichosporon asahii var. asahii CBS 8904]|uniref:Uncharacterized protein n=2 Tax=Trichosporon asahii var. asahii TaxID=189963 RepID=K1WWQ0_TRIAC|nr:hypothetical protein A1Q1_03989 [Trichosporon asahii var. asahii CBS 2479]EJT52473.1 hypothetical protein A1Q1_03989 [Trichosporon asahii var. asahii CBS 2479]EKD05129.1 hypothetical protein A1Q2_00550 [Trichosporon asahii var. asahii CBS 8904]
MGLGLDVQCLPVRASATRKRRAPALGQTMKSHSEGKPVKTLIGCESQSSSPSEGESLPQGLPALRARDSPVVSVILRTPKPVFASKVNTHNEEEEHESAIANQVANGLDDNVVAPPLSLAGNERLAGRNVADGADQDAVTEEDADGEWHTVDVHEALCEDAEDRIDVKIRLVEHREDRHHEVAVQEVEEEVEAVLLRPPRAALEVRRQNVDETFNAKRNGDDAEVRPHAAGG